MNRLTDHDKNWGPLTLAPWRKNIRLEFSTGDEESDRHGYRNHLLIVAFGWALRVTLPKAITYLTQLTLMPIFPPNAGFQILGPSSPERSFGILS